MWESFFRPTGSSLTYEPRWGLKKVNRADDRPMMYFHDDFQLGSPVVQSGRGLEGGNGSLSLQPFSLSLNRPPWQQNEWISPPFNAIQSRTRQIIKKKWGNIVHVLACPVQDHRLSREQTWLPHLNGPTVGIQRKWLDAWNAFVSSSRFHCCYSSGLQPSSPVNYDARKSIGLFLSDRSSCSEMSIVAGIN